MRFRLHQDDARSATRRLLLLFAVLLVALVVAVNAVAFGVWWLLLSHFSSLPPLFFECNTALVLLFVGGGCLVETGRLRRGGGAHVAQWAGGREVVDPRDAQERRLLNIVDEMTIASGMPHPRVYVLDREDAINAFASGWTREDAVVAVTRGALDCLTRDELQGLIAHEFGHIQQDDLRLNMVLLALVWGLSLVHGYGASLLEVDERGNRSGPGLLIGAAFVAAGWVGWVAGQILQAAVSRQRELLADACAIQFTRSREGLGGTLRKVWFQVQQHDDRLRHVPVNAMAAMLLQAPAGWLASHPPLPERLRRLYGHTVEPLRATKLALRADEEPRRVRSFGAMVGAMPMAEAGLASWVAAPPGAEPLARKPRVVADASARSTKPTPSPEATAASVPAPRPVPTDDEREAFGRLQRLNGPGELRAAILALTLTPGSRRERRAWRDETRALGSAEAVGAEIDKLSPAARLPWLEVLLDRAARSPMADRQDIAEAVRRVMSADGQIRPIDRLLWLALRRRLTPRPPMPPASDAHNDLALLPPTLREQATRLTAFLSRVVPGGADPRAGEAWFRAVTRHWVDDEGAAGDGVAVRCEPPDADGLANAVAELQTLPWMLRPVLARLWVDASLTLSPLGRLDDGAADALRLASYLIDSPLPPELARHHLAVPVP